MTTQLSQEGPYTYEWFYFTTFPGQAQSLSPERLTSNQMMMVSLSVVKKLCLLSAGTISPSISLGPNRWGWGGVGSGYTYVLNQLNIAR